MNTDKIAVTPQEEEEWKLRNQLIGNQSFKAPGKDGEHLGEPKVEPKVGEHWLLQTIKRPSEVFSKTIGWEFSAEGLGQYYNFISRLYTQEEYDSKGVNDSVWKNGDECVIRGETLFYVGESKEEGVHVVQECDSDRYRSAHISALSKPETPEQKEAREQLESAYDLYVSWVGNMPFTFPLDFDEFTSENLIVNKWLRVLDKTGYRK